MSEGGAMSCLTRPLRFSPLRLLLLLGPPRGGLGGRLLGRRPAGGGAAPSLEQVGQLGLDLHRDRMGPGHLALQLALGRRGVRHRPIDRLHRQHRVARTRRDRPTRAPGPRWCPRASAGWRARTPSRSSDSRCTRRGPGPAPAVSSRPPSPPPVDWWLPAAPAGFRSRPPPEPGRSRGGWCRGDTRPARPSGRDGRAARQCWCGGVPAGWEWGGVPGGSTWPAGAPESVAAAESPRRPAGCSCASSACSWSSSPSPCSSPAP